MLHASFANLRLLPLVEVRLVLRAVLAEVLYFGCDLSLIFVLAVAILFHGAVSLGRIIENGACAANELLPQDHACW